MPWKRLIAGMEDIFGSPGPQGLTVDSPRVADWRELMRKCGIAKLRSKDIADGYLALVPRKQRRGKGVYYTPQQVVEFILDQSLPQPRIGKREDDPYPDGFRLLEPTCGAGYFLLTAYRRLRETYRKAEDRTGDGGRAICQDRLAAVDIDGKALMIALAAMLVEIGDEIDPSARIRPDPMPLFRADFLDKFYRH